MKDLKNLDIHDICIRATKETGEEIQNLFADLGFIDEGYIWRCDGYFCTDKKYPILYNYVTEGPQKNKTELSIEDLRSFVKLKTGEKEEEQETKNCLKNSFENLFQKHIDFSSKAFPDSSWQSSLIGLRREIKEVEEEIPSGNLNTIAVEYADCFLYLLDSMNRAGVSISDLKTAIQSKIEINVKREWKQNEDGSYSHIKSPKPKN